MLGSITSSKETVDSKMEKSVFSFLRDSNPIPNEDAERFGDFQLLDAVVLLNFFRRGIAVFYPALLTKQTSGSPI